MRYMGSSRGLRTCTWGPIVTLFSALLFLTLFSNGAFDVVGASDFTLRPGVILVPVWEGEPFVPMLLSNTDSIAGWSILFDNTNYFFGELWLVDSLQALDPLGDTLRWYYAPWAGHPEQRPERLKVQYQDWWTKVRITGTMDVDSPEDTTPPIPPGEDQLLFGLDLFIGGCAPESSSIVFVTESCDDNVVWDSHNTVWGPDTLSASRQSCLNRPDTLRAVALSSGPVARHRAIDCGDVNENGVPYEIGDYIRLYSAFLSVRLCSNVEHAADIDGCRGVTIHDTRALYKIMEEGWPPPDTCPPSLLPQVSPLDTLIIGNTMLYPGYSVVIDVEIANSDSLTSLTVPLCYDTMCMHPESVMVDDAWADWGLKLVKVDDPPGTVIISMTSLGPYNHWQDPKLPPGHYDLASILFKADSAAEQGMTTVDVCSTKQFWLQLDCRIPTIASRFIRADANGDMGITIGDAVYIIGHIYRGGPCDCEDACDVNDDGRITSADAVYLVSYIYRAGLAPPSPFPHCGVSDTPDALGCVRHPCGGRR